MPQAYTPDGSHPADEGIFMAQEIYADCIQTLKDLPSAQPEIIRCKDCKHWMPYEWMFSEVWQSKNIADYHEDDIGCALSDMAMKANDFCSRAERRLQNDIFGRFWIGRSSYGCGSYDYFCFIYGEVTE